MMRAVILWLCLLMAGCAGLPPATPAPASEALTDVAGTRLARSAATAASQARDKPGGASGFRLLPEAPFALDARLALINRAQKSLDVQYYLIQDDPVGRWFLRELAAAAARGVRVRLLMDDLYTGGEDPLLHALAAMPGVEVRLFNPLPSRASSTNARVLLSLHEFGRVNHRMHNKMLVADNRFAVSGGRNIAAEYFMQASAANYIDVDLLSVGPIVQDMSRAFDRYWNSAQVRPIAQVAPPPAPAELQQLAQALMATPPAPVPVRARDVLDHAPVAAQLDEDALDLIWATARFFADDPAKMTRADAGEAYRGSVTEGAQAAMNSAHREVTIVSPYFVPGARGMAMMSRAMGLGGRINLITNSLGSTDEPLVYAGYARYREEMLKIGVQIREIGPTNTGRSGTFGDFGRSISRLHAKLAVIDDDRLFIGSMNLDPRSAVLNTEAGSLIESRALVADYLRLQPPERVNAGYRLRMSPSGRSVQWLEHNPGGDDLVHEGEPNGSVWLQLKLWLLSPWVSESLL